MKDLLGGVRIVDATSIIFGPMASQTLADLGADVIKIEPPEGDLVRHSGAIGPDGNSAVYANNNRNKKSLAVDLRRPEGRAILERLIAGADVVLHNMRPKAAEKLGLSPADARRSNPSIIHCAAVGFGRDGPYGGAPAYDDVIQAASGLAALPVEVGGTPTYVPSVMADKVGALHVVYAILAALVRRGRTGEGCDIEVPMFEAMVAVMFNEHMGAATFAEDGTPGYGRLFSPNRRPFATKDGWIAVLPYSGAQWTRTLTELGQLAVTEEPWFATAAGRNANADQLYRVMVAALPERTTDEWMDVFDRLDVPHARVNRLEDLLHDPHLEATGFFKPTDGLKGRHRSVPQPVAFEGVPGLPDRAAPPLGADAEEVLSALGYGAAEIAALRDGGTIV